MRTLGWNAALVAGVIALWVPAQGWAQAVTPLPQRLDDDPVTPRMMGLGGRAEALSSSTSTMFGNPAMLAAMRVYHIDGYLLYDPTISRFSSGSAMVDSTRTISAGVSYVYNRIDSSVNHRTGHDLRLDVALPLGNVVGVGARIRYSQVSMGPPVAASNSTLSSQGWDGFLFDAGVFVRPVSILMLSASGRNLNNPDTTAAPIGAAFGAVFSPFSTLNLVADVLLDFRMAGTMRGRYSGGAELFLGDHYVLRAGYMFDDIRAQAQAITWGVAYLDQSFGIEVSMRQGFTPTSQTTLMLALRYFYQAN